MALRFCLIAVIVIVSLVVQVVFFFEHDTQLGYGFVVAQVVAAALVLVVVGNALRSLQRKIQHEHQVSHVVATNNITSKVETDQHHRERREHEEFVTEIFSSIQDGIFIIDNDYKIVRTNPTFDAMYSGYMPLVGKKCWETSGLDCICPDCPAERMFKSGKLEYSVHEEPATSQTPGMWLEHFSHPLVDSDGKVLGGINFIRDITKRKELEDSLKRYQTELEEMVKERTTKLAWSESRMDAVLAGNVAILFYRPDGITEAVNLAFEHLVGYTESEIVGQNVMGLVQEEYRKPMWELLQYFVAQNKVTMPRLEIPAIHKDGRALWFDCSITGIFDDAGKLAQLVIVCMDVTEKRSLVERLEIAKQIAEQSTRSKSDFLANMSHEIRTPMNAILGMTYLCLQTDLNAKQRDYLEKSQAATSGLLSVINDILDFSKIEAGKLALEEVSFSLGQAMREVGDVLEQKIVEKGVTFQTTIDADVPDALVGDPLRLKQVLLNLVGNAIKFTDKGTINVSVTREKTGGDVAAESAPDSAIVIAFSVQDTGIGMDADQLSRLFTAFTQADSSTTRKYGGTGLGLAISKNLVALLGGHIEVTSTPNVGTTFRFTVNMHMDDEQYLDDDEASSVSQDLHWASVLLVEDNKVNQIVAKELLQSCNVSVTIANDGLEAVELVKHNDFHLILMDVQMPNMDGLEATRVIRQLDKPGLDKLPIVAMTAHAMQADFEQSIAAGMNAHLTKPIDPTKLRKALAKWLKR